MFGNAKHKAFALVVEGMRPILKVSEGRSGRLPEGYWDDSFVLGFFNGYAGTLAKVATYGKINASELGETLIGALEKLAPGQGMANARRMKQLLVALDADAIKGVNHGTRCVAYLYNLTNLEHDTAVIEAKEACKLTTILPLDMVGPAAERLKVAGALVKILYGDVMLKRLS